MICNLTFVLSFGLVVLSHKSLGLIQVWLFSNVIFFTRFFPSLSVCASRPHHCPVGKQKATQRSPYVKFAWWTMLSNRWNCKCGLSSQVGFWSQCWQYPSGSVRSAPWRAVYNAMLNLQCKPEPHVWKDFCTQIAVATHVLYMLQCFCKYLVNTAQHIWWLCLLHSHISIYSMTVFLNRGGCYQP